MKKETVVEMCPHCETEVEMVWDTERYGYNSFCPHCGERLMLCDECLHHGDEPAWICDYNSKTDSCRRNIVKSKVGYGRMKDIASRLIGELANRINKFDGDIYEVLSEIIGMSDDEMNELGINEDGFIWDEEEDAE